MSDDEPLLGMKAIAEWLGVSRPTVHRWVRELGLPVVSFGGTRAVFTTKKSVMIWVLSIADSGSKYPSGGLPKFTKRN